MPQQNQSRIPQLLDAISDEVGRLFDSVALDEWRQTANLRHGDLVVINNSFLYRDGISTRTKNAKYLCVSVDSAGDPVLLPSIATANRVNARFKRVASRQAKDYSVVSLHNAVASELSRTGTIIQALVARIGDDEAVDVEIDGTSTLKILRYDPDLRAIAKIERETLSVSRLDDIDVVWQAVAAEMANVAYDSDQLAESFEGLFVELRESAGRPIIIDDIDPTGQSILASVTERVEEQVLSYSAALSTYQQDPDNTEALNELLRIAYNFADGTKDLLGLVVGLSDLKPLVSWLTISSQSELADRFADLPFALIGKAKPSFERYRTVISSARNRAFHDVFAFGRPFHVRLPGEAFRSAELRLFQEYSRRSRPGLDFEDRELVELLAGFTRVSERPVPLGFWDKNLHVMRAVAEVTRRLRDALVLISG